MPRASAVAAASALDQSFDRPVRQRSPVTDAYDGEHLGPKFVVGQWFTVSVYRHIEQVVVPELGVASTAGDLVEHQAFAHVQRTLEPRPQSHRAD